MKPVTLLIALSVMCGTYGFGQSMPTSATITNLHSINELGLHCYGKLQETLNPFMRDNLGRFCYKDDQHPISPICTGPCMTQPRPTTICTGDCMTKIPDNPAPICTGDCMTKLETPTFKLVNPEDVKTPRIPIVTDAVQEKGTEHTYCEDPHYHDSLGSYTGVMLHSAQYPEPTSCSKSEHLYRWNETYYSCADKSAVMLTTEEGKRLCVRFQ